MSNWYRNIDNAILVDDRKVAIFPGGRAFLSDERAGRILAVRPGSLKPAAEPECEPDRDRFHSEVESDRDRFQLAEPECDSECEPECASECEPEFDDVRAEYQSLHHKTRKKVARELGGGDGMNTADADAFVLSLPDDALDELRRVIDGAK